MKTIRKISLLVPGSTGFGWRNIRTMEATTGIINILLPFCGGVKSEG